MKNDMSDDKDILTLLRARRIADEANERVDRLIEKLKDKNKDFLMSMKKVKIGLRACTAILNKQFQAIPMPEMRKKTRVDAAASLADYVVGDENVKDYSREELIDFFIEFGNLKAYRSIAFDDFWFQEFSEKFRLSIKHHESMVTEDWTFNQDNDEDSDGHDE